MSITAQVTKKTTLNGTIDGHDPLLVRWRIKGPQGWFWLTFATINLGRGYTPEQFKANVRRLLNAVEDHEYVVIILQEIDEADLSPEHKIIRAMVNDLTGRAQFIQWWTREPIIVIGPVKITHEGKRMTMDQGSAIGTPKGTGPRRFITFARLVIEGVVIGVANQHPHRYSLWNLVRYRPIRKALKRGERVTRRVIGMLARTCDFVIDGGDLNTKKYPLSHPKQVVYRRGLDYIRWFITNRKANQ